MLSTTIGVLETKKDARKEEILKEMKNFDKVVLYSSGVVLILKDDKSHSTARNKVLRLILLSDLIEHMDCLESWSIDVHFKYGLAKDIDRNGTISIVNLRDKKLKFHVFNKAKNSAANSSLKYDIPVYDNSAPAGFSLFMSQEEKYMIEAYIQKNGWAKVNKEEEVSQYTLINANNTIPNPENIPLPRKEHNFCHLCLFRYDDYFKHIESNGHMTNRQKNSGFFDRLSNTFERVRGFWETKKIEEEDKLIKQQEMINTELNKNSHNCIDLCSNDVITNTSTKCETNAQLNNVIPILQSNCEKNINTQLIQTKKPQEINEQLGNELPDKNTLHIPSQENDIVILLEEDKENINIQNNIDFVEKNMQNSNNKLSARKRRLSEIEHNCESFETELKDFHTSHKQSYKNKFTRKEKKKEFSGIVQKLDNIKSLLKRSTEMKIN
jgi:hypothetical protein